jgi:hypothetical protein
MGLVTSRADDGALVERTVRHNLRARAKRRRGMEERSWNYWI